MKQTKTGRVLATLSLGVLFGCYKHFDDMRWLGRGRDAFLSDQSLRFAKMVQTHSMGFMLIAGILLSAIAVGLYELLAAAFTKAIPANQVEG